MGRLGRALVGLALGLGAAMTKTTVFRLWDGKKHEVGPFATREEAEHHLTMLPGRGYFVEAVERNVVFLTVEYTYDPGCHVGSAYEQLEDAQAATKKDLSLSIEVVEVMT